MNDEIHAILANAEGLRHLQDDECYRLGETVIKAISALNAEERQELADLIKNHNNKGVRQLLPQERNPRRRRKRNTIKPP